MTGKANESDVVVIARKTFDAVVSILRERRFVADGCGEEDNDEDVIAVLRLLQSDASSRLGGDQ